MKQDPSVILFCDSSSGIYIPQRFADEIDRQYVTGIDLALLDQLSEIDLTDSEQSEDYWFTWCEIVLNNCKIVKDDKTWILYQDGDLWLLDFDNMTEAELENFGFND